MRSCRVVIAVCLLVKTLQLGSILASSNCGGGKKANLSKGNNILLVEIFHYSAFHFETELPIRIYNKRIRIRKLGSRILKKKLKCSSPK
jgi:hypothetical protein